MKHCYYSYGNGCPGIMAPSNRHVMVMCQRCRDFNGNLGKVTVGKKEQAHGERKV